MGERAGNFPKTVMLRRPVVGADSVGLGHKPTTYVDAFRCAARIWTRSIGDQAFNPADFIAGSFRLLLRMPQKGIEVGWGLNYEGKAYKIADIEDRGSDRLVTLEPI